MAELFLFGTFWFWALVAFELTLLFIFTEREWGVGATLSLLIFGAVLQIGGNVDVFGFIWSHPIHILLGACAYFLLGVGWGVFKWRQFVLKKLRKYNEFFRDFLKDKGLPADTKVLPVQLRDEWKLRLNRKQEYDAELAIYRDLQEPPSASKNKARIIRWMSLWVFSMVLYFLKDMVIEIFSNIYERLAFFLQKISDDIFASAAIKQNLEIPPPPQENDR